MNKLTKEIIDKKKMSPLDAVKWYFPKISDTEQTLITKQLEDISVSPHNFLDRLFDLYEECEKRNINKVPDIKIVS